MASTVVKSCYLVVRIEPNGTRVPISVHANHVLARKRVEEHEAGVYYDSKDCTFDYESIAYYY